MVRDISPMDIRDNIETTLALLKKQEYVPQTIVLSTEERKRLYDFFYTYSTFGLERSRYPDYYYLKEQAAVDKINEQVFLDMDDEVRTIIEKCGVDPKAVFAIYKTYCEMNIQLSNCMGAYSIAKIGDYTIEFTRDCPINRDSEQINNFIESVQQKKYETYKNGEANFRVFTEINGQIIQIYWHVEDMHFGGCIKFKDYQIGGNFGMKGFSFSISSGMMKKDEGIASCINELMPFFESFQALLNEELSSKTSQSNSTADSKGATLKREI